MTREEAEYTIENEKQQQPALAAITSISKAGVWTQLRFVYATVAEWIYSQWEVFRDELETLVNTRRWATVAWYIEKAKEFQAGDMLELLPNGQFGYPSVREEKRIIQQAAIEVVGREFRFKVATEKDGELMQLPDSDMVLFRSYINQIKRPGTPIRFINYQADRLVLSLRVFYDGELIEQEVETAIRDVIKNYLNNLVFNGVFSVTKLIDQIQKVNGVTECVYIAGSAWSAAQTEDQETVIEDRHRAASGYYKIAEKDDTELLYIEMIREL